jgi:hypothetical protein
VTIDVGSGGATISVTVLGGSGNDRISGAAAKRIRSSVGQAMTGLTAAEAMTDFSATPAQINFLAARATMC